MKKITWHTQRRMIIKFSKYSNERLERMVFNYHYIKFVTNKLSPLKNELMTAALMELLCRYKHTPLLERFAAFYKTKGYEIDLSDALYKYNQIIEK